MKAWVALCECQPYETIVTCTSAWINMEFTIARSDLVQYFSAVSIEILGRGKSTSGVQWEIPMFHTLSLCIIPCKVCIERIDLLYVRIVVYSVLWYMLRCVDHTLCFVFLQERIQYSSGHKVWLISVWPLFTATCTCS